MIPFTDRLYREWYCESIAHRKITNRPAKRFRLARGEIGHLGAKPGIAALPGPRQPGQRCRHVARRQQHARVIELAAEIAALGRLRS